MTTTAPEITCPAPGIYPGTDFLTYAQWPAVNQSLLKHHAKSDAHAREAMLRPADATGPQMLGEATHAAILEPARFAAQYATMPVFPGHPNSNAHKAAKSEWLAAHGDKVALSADERRECEAMSKAVWAHPVAAQLLSGKGMNELSVVWRDTTTGLMCKGRIDRLAQYRTPGVKLPWSVVVDIKTTRDASLSGFMREIAKYHYHVQAPWYLDGLSALAPAPRRYMWIAVENAPPYGVAVYEPEADALEEGRKLARLWLTRHHTCLQSKCWPAYPTEVQPISIPAYAFTQGDME